MIVALILFGFIAVGLGIGLVATAAAPLGYQDASGFHYGQRQGVSEPELACAVPQPKPA